MSSLLGVATASFGGEAGDRRASSKLADRPPFLSLSRTSNRIDVINDLKSLLGLTEVLAVPVLHRCRCWGLVITHQSGWKAACVLLHSLPTFLRLLTLSLSQTHSFSGDTMPCDALVEAGQGASLLIHEATIQDDMPEVAHAKGHSTFGQAIDVARR